MTKAEIQRNRYELGLCMSCGEERHSFLFPCEPMLQDRREESVESEESEENDID